MSRYCLSALAQSDLDDIWVHVAREAGPETADRLIDEIVQRFLLLSRHPEAGRLRVDISPGVRSFPVQSYIVYYRVAGDRIEVARVLHGSRDQQSAFEQDRKENGTAPVETRGHNPRWLASFSLVLERGLGAKIVGNLRGNLTLLVMQTNAGSTA